MLHSKKHLFLQTVGIYLTFVVAGITSYLAWDIGKRQNKINEQALNIQNFVETFVMPQEVYAKDEQGKPMLLYYNL